MKTFIAAGIAMFIISLRGAGAQPKLTTIYTWANTFPAGLTEVNGRLYVAGALDIGCGSVARLDPPTAAGSGWSASVLYSFAGSGADGCVPLYGPVAGPNGSLYGLTSFDGPNGSGTLYQLRPPASREGPWSEQVLYSFTAPPQTPLIPGPGGSFYVMNLGGDYGAGALLQLIPPATLGTAWTGVQLQSIGEGTSPAGPTSLIAGPGGSLYASSYYGGDSYFGFGTVFQLNPPATDEGSWTTAVLHSFGAGVNGASLAHPGPLVVASDGTLYGTAYGDDLAGPSIGGVFALTPPATPGGEWAHNVLYSFHGGLNTAWPAAPHPDIFVILDGGSLIFGVQSQTGGYLFELRPPSTQSGAWSLIPLHEFANAQMPVGQMFIDARGTLFGIQGSAANDGQPFTGSVYMVTGITP